MVGKTEEYSCYKILSSLDGMNYYTKSMMCCSDSNFHFFLATSASIERIIFLKQKLQFSGKSNQLILGRFLMYN